MSVFIETVADVLASRLAQRTLKQKIIIQVIESSIETISDKKYFIETCTIVIIYRDGGVESYLPM